MKNIIPQPASLTPAEGFFEVGRQTQIWVQPNSEEMCALGQQLADFLNPATGFEMAVLSGDCPPEVGCITLAAGAADPPLGGEGYQLTISPRGVRLEAPFGTGIFRGLQTLRQLLPAKIENSDPQPGPWHIPAGVIRELAALTPGPYIHIGGDEAHSTPKDDYRYFIERVEPLVQKYGKQMIGWEEIVQCELAPTSVIQYWAQLPHALAAAQRGLRVLMSPAQHTYLDMKYDPGTPLGLDWAGTVSVEQSYNWDPATAVEGLAEDAILGVEAPLWAETLRTLEDVTFMALPRLAGIAEVGWSPAAALGWEAYLERLAAQGPRWQAQGYHFFRTPEIPWA